MSPFLRRETQLEHVESNEVSHSFLLRKPRTHEPVDEPVGVQRGGEDEAQVDNPIREKRRFELFIDLIWVGIIGNLADHFSDQAFSTDTKYTVGRAIFEFVLLFLVAWRMWKFLQEFMSKYRTNDLMERMVVVWLLILAVCWGNDAPYILNPEEPSSLAISVYLVFKVSILAVEAYYSVHLPYIRRRIILQSAMSIPILALWLPAFWLRYLTRGALLIAAIVLEYWTSALVDTPLAARFIKDERSEILHTGHWVERVQDFYVIILGEGVLNLIRGSPLGIGITPKTGAGVSALWVYYVLSCLFFNGDSSKRYVHATRRTWWRRILWLSFHVSMFGSTLILGVSLTYLIQNLHTNAIDPSGGGDGEAHKLAMSIYSAKWIASSTLAIILFNQTKIALLNRPLDGPHTLKVNSRYLRLTPRVVAGIVVLCLPISRQMDGGLYIGIVSLLLIPVLIWEWTASLDYGGGLVEPKYLS